MLTVMVANSAWKGPFSVVKKAASLCRKTYALSETGRMLKIKNCETLEEGSPLEYNLCIKGDKVRPCD